MGVLTEIAFELDVCALAELAGVPSNSADLRLFESLAGMAQDVARPKALYRECFVESKGEQTVAVEGITFTSRALGRNR